MDEHAGYSYSNTYSPGNQSVHFKVDVEVLTQNTHTGFSHATN